MTLVEQYNGRGTGYDASGERPTRAFYGSGMTVDQVRDDPGLPKFRDAHPDYPGVIVGSVNVQPAPGGAVATVAYANPSLVTHEPPVNTLDEDFQSLGLTYETVDVDIPLIQTRKIMYGEGSEAEEKIIWADVEGRVPFRVTRTVLRFQTTLVWNTDVNLSVLLGLSSAVLAQSGRIHKFGTKQFLFRPEGITQVTSRWRVVYQWISDPGVPTINDATASAGPNWYLENGLGYPHSDQSDDDGNEYAIPPFQRMDVEPNEDPTLTPYVAYRPFAIEDDNGWMGLPGIAP